MPGESLTTMTAADVALFGRMITDADEFETLSVDEQRDCENALHCAVAFVLDYTGLATLNPAPSKALEYAVKTVAAEMLDNRQITAQYTTGNPTVTKILGMHSTNLLPSC